MFERNFKLILVKGLYKSEKKHLKEKFKMKKEVEKILYKYNFTIINNEDYSFLNK